MLSIFDILSSFDGSEFVTDSILLLNNIDDTRKKIVELKSIGNSIGLVPTMGALHEGHLSLARHSIERCDFTIVSIFVNPTQFAPDEDLNTYPRTLENDLSLLQAENVDAVFAPEINEIYPAGFSTSITPPKLSLDLEGESRPTHFSGVCTIVAKLFNIVLPDRAYFGQKDFQQVAVIQSMVDDLNFPVEVVVCPIVREADGLAMSSRNRYLNEEERTIARSINQTIETTVRLIREGESDAHLLMAKMRQRLIDGGVTSIDYAVIADSKTLTVSDRVQQPSVILVACFVGKTRLIDNGIVS